MEWRSRFRRFPRSVQLLLGVLALYLMLGVVYRVVNLYCWEVSIKRYVLGSVVQPVFVAVDLLTWPLWLALDVVHHVGVFGTGIC